MNLHSSRNNNIMSPTTCRSATCDVAYRDGTPRLSMTASSGRARVVDGWGLFAEKGTATMLRKHTLSWIALMALLATLLAACGGG